MKVMCTSLVLLSLAMLQLPVEQSARDYNTLGNWIDQHLSELNTDDQISDKKDFLNSTLSEYLSLKSSEDMAAELPETPAKSDKDRIISYLYMAWEQHNNASDTAGTFGKDRVQLQLITKFSGFWIAQFSPGTSEASDRLIPFDATRLLSDTLLPSAYTLLAVIGGKSINAP